MVRHPLSQPALGTVEEVCHAGGTFQVHGGACGGVGMAQHDTSDR